MANKTEADAYNRALDARTNYLTDPTLESLVALRREVQLWLSAINEELYLACRRRDELIEQPVESEIFMDIGSGSGYPESALSNFAPHPFELDGIQCASMEGFLQGLKFKNPEMQAHVCTLVGKAAKFKGKKKKWWRTGTLYWRGQEIDRFSSAYQDLLDRAFEALGQNKKFRRALIASGSATLTHSIGKNDEKKTILTVSEFCGRLMRLRAEMSD